MGGYHGFEHDGQNYCEDHEVCFVVLSCGSSLRNGIRLYLCCGDRLFLLLVCARVVGSYGEATSASGCEYLGNQNARLHRAHHYTNDPRPYRMGLSERGGGVLGVSDHSLLLCLCDCQYICGCL